MVDTPDNAPAPPAARGRSNGDTTASVTTTPPAPSTDVTLHKPSFFWTRTYTWAYDAVLAYTLVLAVLNHQPAFAWPIVSVMVVSRILYVGGARGVDIVSILSSTGIIRAAQSAATAVTNVANTVGGLAGQLAPRRDPADERD